MGAEWVASKPCANVNYSFCQKVMAAKDNAHRTPEGPDAANTQTAITVQSGNEAWRRVYVFTL